jgi:xanthine dehydrogenase YagR molybdenum-binding subunit
MVGRRAGHARRDPAVAHTAWSIGHVFGIGEDQVKVSSPYVGGGFGGKTMWQHQILAAAAARLAGRPVRLVLSREGVYRVVGGRTLTEQRVALGAQGDGTLEALIHTGTVAMTRHNALPEPFILPTRGAYAARTVKLDVEVAYLDMLANTFMRAPGESVGTFAIESAMDELAAQLGPDPIELRIRDEPEKDPICGLPFSLRNIVEAYRAGAERFGWVRRDPKPGARREGDWLVGMDCATATYPYYRMPGGAAPITLSHDGHVTVDIAAHEMGMGTSTVHTQVAAERFGLPMEQVPFNDSLQRNPDGRRCLHASAASRSRFSSMTISAASSAAATEGSCAMILSDPSSPRTTKSVSPSLASSTASISDVSVMTAELPTLRIFVENIAAPLLVGHLPGAPVLPRVYGRIYRARASHSSSGVTAPTSVPRVHSRHAALGRSRCHRADSMKAPERTSIPCSDTRARVWRIHGAR